jgi:hypothetical protein
MKNKRFKRKSEIRRDAAKREKMNSKSNPRVKEEKKGRQQTLALPLRWGGHDVSIPATSISVLEELSTYR